MNPDGAAAESAFDPYGGASRPTEDVEGNPFDPYAGAATFASPTTAPDDEAQTD